MERDGDGALIGRTPRSSVGAEHPPKSERALSRSRRPTMGVGAPDARRSSPCLSALAHDGHVGGRPARPPPGEGRERRASARHPGVEARPPGGLAPDESARGRAPGAPPSMRACALHRNVGAHVGARLPPGGLAPDARRRGALRPTPGELENKTMTLAGGWTFLPKPRALTLLKGPRPDPQCHDGPWEHIRSSIRSCTRPNFGPAANARRGSDAPRPDTRVPRIGRGSSDGDGGEALRPDQETGCSELDSVQSEAGRGTEGATRREDGDARFFNSQV